MGFNCFSKNTDGFVPPNTITSEYYTDSFKLIKNEFIQSISNGILGSEHEESTENKNFQCFGSSVLVEKRGEL